MNRITLLLPNRAAHQALRTRAFALIILAGGTLLATIRAGLSQPLPPRIIPSIKLQHQAIHAGSDAVFAVTATGTMPLSYQWRLDGRDLTGQTNKSLSWSAVEPIDEGDYTVVVTNLGGLVTSEPARLWVVPPPSAFIRGDFTNGSYRIPYYYLIPANYTPANSYPLVCAFHGSCGDEITFTNGDPHCMVPWPGYANFPATKVFASYRQQERDPAFVLCPTYTAGSGPPGDSRYVHQMTNLLAAFTSQFNIDAKRMYVVGISSGSDTAWDFIGLRPNSFAGFMLVPGGYGGTATAPRVIKDVPHWEFCAEDDEFGNLGPSQSTIRSLRLAGGNPLYTEYVTGGPAYPHEHSCWMSLSTPAMVDWLLMQRRGVAPTNEPLLVITQPTSEAVLFTGATNLNLAGAARALGQPVTKVVWENSANNMKGNAAGTNAWSVTNLPLRTGHTNLIIITATTTSWAPAFSGSTTFTRSLTVIQTPLIASLDITGSNALLKWTGGGSPYQVQRSTDLTAGGWTGFLLNATPPVSLPLAGQAAFYRIVGQ